jgi:magnesium transporter
MLEYYRGVNGVLTQVECCNSGCWVNAVHPTQDELDHLALEYGVPMDFLTYPLDLDERPRFERDEEYSLIVMQTSFPLVGESDVPYDTVPLGIILTPTNVITVCVNRNPVLEDLKAGRFRTVSTVKKNRFTLQVFLRAAQRYLIDLRNINKQVEAAEDRLRHSTRNEELLELLRLEKSLVYFKTALTANEAMMKRVKRDRVFEAWEDDAELFDDVLVENLQAIEMTDIATNILTSMMDTFANVISNNVNAVVKVLTVATILVAVPTWITGLFGMNVPIPAADRPWAFAVVVGLCVLAAVAMLGIFYRKRWL